MTLDEFWYPATALSDNSTALYFHAIIWNYVCVVEETKIFHFVDQSQLWITPRVGCVFVCVVEGTKIFHFLDESQLWTTPRRVNRCFKINLRCYLTSTNHCLDFSIFLLFFSISSTNKQKHKEEWMHQHSPNKVVNSIHMQMSQHSPTNIYKTFQLFKNTFFKYILQSKPKQKLFHTILNVKWSNFSSFPQSTNVINQWKFHKLR